MKKLTYKRNGNKVCFYVDVDKITPLYHFLCRFHLPYLIDMICWDGQTEREPYLYAHLDPRYSQTDFDELVSFATDFVLNGRSNRLPSHYKKLTTFAPDQPNVLRASWHN